MVDVPMLDCEHLERLWVEQFGRARSEFLNNYGDYEDVDKDARRSADGVVDGLVCEKCEDL